MAVRGLSELCLAKGSLCKEVQEKRFNSGTDWLNEVESKGSSTFTVGVHDSQPRI